MNNAGCRPFDVRPLEVEGSPLVQRRSVHSFWTISGTDVAEPAFLPAGHSSRGFVGETRRINAPRFCTNWSSMASPEMRTVWSR